MAEVMVQAAGVAGATYSYDLVPYESQPFAQSQPDQTGAMARLFGLSPVAPERARVLELGCSAGGNIIPLAARYPKMQVTGIELSRVEVEQGQATIKALGLKNIQIRQANILDVAAEDAKYDYIIVHGVYSWVPPVVQEAILKLCGAQLSDDGVAYISYNVYPGWKMREVIREMMLFHAGGLTDPAAKLQQGRAILDYARKINNEQSAFGKLLSQEAEIVNKASDYYLFHDHMEENNNPCYFKDFATRSDHHGLAYLGEASLVDMAPQRFGGDIAETLTMLSNGSILATEQYMDFFTNRMFRQTLLVKATAAPRIRRALSGSSLRHLNFTAAMARDTTAQASDALGVYKDGFGRVLTVREPVMLAVADALVESNPFSVSVDDVVKMLRARKVGEGQDDAILEEAVGSQFLTLLMQGMVRIYCSPIVKPGTPKKVRAFGPARLAASQPPASPGKLRVAPTVFHHVAGLTDPQAALLALMDGSRTADDLTDAMLAQFAEGKFTATQDGKTVEDQDALRVIVDAFCRNALQDFVRTGLMAP